ncbi:hypothetical protein SUDANB58_01594 [Streptomyces sp. enrichment culture]|uniref:hypothetical protein n=1 Tax=Streptomyces sp. enrichment culture TaxID=1795815 RepID=UPI003F5546D0
MTACAIETSTGFGEGGTPRAGCAITADGAYAARLALSGGCRYPERWTLDGPEPYAVPLPSRQPEEPGTEVQPMSDGRVLVHRTAAGRHLFALLYPTGPGTGELPLGAVACAEEGARLRLLPPAPGGTRAYALATGRYTTSVWLVAGGADGPERLAEIHGRCSGGVWLDRAGRMLAVDREAGGCTKAVVVDLARGGEVSPLLQIAPGSDDRVLLADPDSGLLLVRSDAPSPGRPRLGWGVLGSALPVRFPECLLLPDCAVTPFAIQPGQALTPEGCAVALRIDGAFGSWVGVWRPAERRVHHLPAPQGWLAGAGLWTADGALCLPYATAAVPCGLARPAVPAPREDRGGEAGRARSAGPGTAVRGGTQPSSAPAAPFPAPGGGAEPVSPGRPSGPAPGGRAEAAGGGYAEAAPGGPAEPVPNGYAEPVPDTEADPAVPAAATRPMPLQQALLGRLVTK